MLGDQLKTSGLQGHWYVIVISGLISLWGARGVANAAQNAFNSVWNVPYVSRPGFPSALGRSFGLLAIMAVTVLITGFLSGVGGSSGALGILLRTGVILLSTVINVGMFLVGFRLAIANEIRLRQFALAAGISAVVWQILLTAGSYLVAHQVSHAEALYGTFGVVLGLVAWLRLQAQLTLYALEADVVRARDLWPRSVNPPPLTKADRRAYQSYAEEAKRNAEDLEVAVQNAPASEADPEADADADPKAAQQLAAGAAAAGATAAEAAPEK